MSENMQLASMLVGPRGASPQSISSRKEPVSQFSQSPEGPSVHNDADNVDRDSVPGRKQATAFDKVLSKRLERKPDETSELTDTPEPSDDAQINPEALTLAKLLASFKQPFADTTAEGVQVNAQQAKMPGVTAQSASTASATATLPTVTLTGEQSPKTETALYSPPADPLAREILAGQGRAASEKPAVPETAPAQKTTQASQAVDPAARQTVMQTLTGKPVPDPNADLNPKHTPNLNSDTEQVQNSAETKDVAKANPASLLTEGSVVQPHISEVSAAHSPAATFAQAHMQSKAEMPEAQAKPNFSMTETAEVFKIRASDPVTASRTVEQITQKLSLEQPVRADQQIRLTLTPQELGTIRITFREQNNEIVGLLEVQKPQTRKELEESMPQLLSSMQGQGVQVRRIEVVQWNAPQQQSRDSLFDTSDPSAEREFLHQRTGQPNDGSSNQRGFSRPDSFSTGSNPSSTDTAEIREWFTDKGLNLYI
jgi:flagellar hook-length control protein FliK